MKKSFKLHISPKRYQWFEVGTEDEQAVDGNAEATSKELFERIKRQTFEDAISVLSDINCPLSDEKLAQFENLLSTRSNHAIQNNVVTVNVQENVVEAVTETGEPVEDVVSILDGYIANFPAFDEPVK